MSVRAITDRGAEIDRVDLLRTAGQGRSPSVATATPSSWRVDRRTGLSVPGFVGV